MDLKALRDALAEFVGDRDWGQFHTPKNLATALSVEAGELLEHFQWLQDGSLSELGDVKLSEVQDELADVLLYLVMLSDKLSIDLLAAAAAKLEKNAVKYPVAKARGTAKKYSEI